MRPLPSSEQGLRAIQQRRLKTIFADYGQKILAEASGSRTFARVENKGNPFKSIAPSDENLTSPESSPRISTRGVWVLLHAASCQFGGRPVADQFEIRFL